MKRNKNDCGGAGATPWKYSGAQLKQARAAAESSRTPVGEGHELIISHGNGPQVGIINSAMNVACGPVWAEGRTPYMFCRVWGNVPGFIGYHPTSGLLCGRAFRKGGEFGKTVVSVVTQVRWSPGPAFLQIPLKPIRILHP